MSANVLPDVTAAPAAGQRIQHENVEYTTVSEGLAHILVPASASSAPERSPRGDHQPQAVFYNPIQQFNRDLSVLAIKASGGEEVMEKKRKSKAASRRRDSARNRRGSEREKKMD